MLNKNSSEIEILNIMLYNSNQLLMENPKLPSFSLIGFFFLFLAMPKVW